MSIPTINYNDLDYSAYGVSLLEPDALPPIPQPRIDVQDVPFGGGVSQGQYYQAVSFSVPVMVEGEDPTDLTTRLRLIAAGFNVTADKVLYFANTEIDDVFWYARRSHVSGPKNKTRTSIEFDWEFICPDPIAQDRTLNTQNEAPAGTPHAFNLPTAGVIGGNDTATPIYTITSTGANAGPITLTNSTRTETLTYNSSLANTHILRIDTSSNTFTVEKSTDGGTTWSSVMINLIAYSFPRLTHGVQNVMSLVGATNTTMAVTWRDRHLLG